MHFYVLIYKTTLFFNYKIINQKNDKRIHSLAN